MVTNPIERRSFLKKATQTLLAAPAVATLNNLAIAEPSSQSQPKSQSDAHRPKPVITLNVRDYGATGDGATKDTAAIQQTIDRCAVLVSGPLLNISNVTGKGLAGATTIDPPKLPDPIPTPATPYKLH